MGGMRAGPDPGALANRSRRARKGKISTLQRPRWNLPSLPVLNTLVLIHLKGKEVTCRVHTMQAKGPGEEMELAFDMSKVVFFDPKTEQRIA